MKLPNIPIVNHCLLLSDYILPNCLFDTDLLNIEQQQHFKGLKSYYFQKVVSLLSVINGYDRFNFFKSNLDITLNEFEIEYLELELTLYELVKYGWNEVSKLFSQYNASTSDEAILLIYKFQAIHYFLECLAFDSRLYPASIYREFNSLNIIKSKRKLGKDLTKKEEKLVNKAIKRYRKNETKDFAIALYLIERCEKTWSRSKNHTVKLKFDTYNRQKNSLIDEVKKPFNPRLNPKPIGWLQGTKVG